MLGMVSMLEIAAGFKKWVLGVALILDICIGYGVGVISAHGCWIWCE